MSQAPGLRGRAILRRFAGLVVVAALSFGVPDQGWAQTTDDAPPAATGSVTGPVKSPAVPGVSGAAKPTKSISITPAVRDTPDYTAWERLALRAEAGLLERSTSNQGLELLRAQLVDWRAALLLAQNANSSRIATLRTQIETLGPVPAEGEVEPEEIAARRKALTDQLLRLQAPGIAAEEAYTRADGLIREIDRVLRERQADELLKLSPSPVNPANWPPALAEITASAVSLYAETVEVAAGPRAGRDIRDNLPLILVLLVAALILLLRGRRWIDIAALRMSALAPDRNPSIEAVLASLVQVLVPVAGLYALSQALQLSGLLGAEGRDIARFLPIMGLIVCSAIWLGGRMFPAGAAPAGFLSLSHQHRTEGRFHSAVLGLVLGLDALRLLVFPAAEVGDAATAVLGLPLICIAGLSLFRLGRLLPHHVRRDQAPTELVGYRNRLIVILARALLTIAIIGPLLAVVGYVSAAAALVYGAALTFGLLGALIVAQKLVTDLFAATLREDLQRQFALFPVLAGFALTVATLPVLALIWGARPEDLTELWNRFREGFQFGESRISPTDFLYFVIIFGVGYTLTRLFQSALKSSILPNTRLDSGGQNAIVAGSGYLGIFLAGLVAINAVGIDLSGLAIVAGALSLGIGFGLQNIVSNFVSGIILLIERPISEGDWIEIGTVSGTVRAISVRSTRIQTFDRSDVIVPNADLVTQRVTNWTRYNLSGRLIVPVSVAHGNDPLKVERILREIAEAQPMAVLNPAPQVLLMGFTEAAWQYEIRMILRDVNFNLNVRSDINREILRRFADEEVSLSRGVGQPSEPPPRFGAVEVRQRQASPKAPKAPDAPAPRRDDDRKGEPTL
jgi:potassium-dependent mechanosensitive channel